MSREELLVLRKTLKDLLDRGFIRASSSAAAAPVLFRDRYPLPSSRRPCRIWPRLSGSPLDVVAAFHKIRMAPGHEGKTAFRTRFGLYEWLVCPFGLSGAPRAIREWEALTTVKGVRSFLGFANYYRIFIPDYAKITQSLDALLKKGTAFHWGRAENEAFQELKRRFCESPVLKQWDPSLLTFWRRIAQATHWEASCRRKRLSPAEYNYPIHDKEMLAIMRCLDNWNAELRSCGPFTILTDHRNLEYFMTRQKLTERQSRWAAELSQFDFKLEYRPGSEAVVPDALSRREQDKPQGIDDEREQGRMIQLIPDSAIPSSTRACINAMSSDCSEASTLPKMKVFEVADLQQLWDETVAKDSIFRAAYKAVRDRERAFPPSLGLKIQISECAIDAGKG
ncbi:retrotransposon nucleocapsid protein [Hirsutella rhossiliensis]|uniref:Retrotransposon nucleocapsid protein n=1 Tax=Hirsutella rhossiliensis TaxID=111463 RepID=A0A9P8SDD1_9HYPO|nr:retrotransposon nucleocapsid protein [Hirsutella rhossiliensis]KAH0957829.1 retrotransposon nucleocapsid protein [Hirsutella rhossiliensis]